MSQILTPGKDGVLWDPTALLRKSGQEWQCQCIMAGVQCRRLLLPNMDMQVKYQETRLALARIDPQARGQMQEYLGTLANLLLCTPHRDEMENLRLLARWNKIIRDDLCAAPEESAHAESSSN